MTPTDYRHELDGLRAIAVLAVLGYHAGYNDFAGGFIGVDVFLVLSGYLITQQITGQLRAGSFAPFRFWLRRARRLLPTMVPVLAFSALSALILKGDAAFEEFVRRFLSAGLFYSNYQFASEVGGYFAGSSNTNLLKHTWSLSLEWQFYLVMPVVLLLLHRFGRWGMLAGLFAVAAGSLFYAEWLIAAGDSDWAFYAVAPRFWEFVAGAIIALLQPTLARLPLPGLLMRAAGLALILNEILLYQGGDFPGFGALASVLGTALILAAPTGGKDPFRWMLTRGWMQWLGLRSYAIYLIHWPLFVTVTPSNMNKSEGILSVALLVSLYLGHLIYRYIETPVRTGARFKPSGAIMGYGSATLAAIALISVLMQTAPVGAVRSALPLSEIRIAANGLDVARDTYMALLDRIHSNEVPGIQFCSFDSIETTADALDCLTAPDIPDDAILLIGDSHGRDALASLIDAFPEQGFVTLHQSACVPATYIRGRSLCFSDLETILTTLAQEGRLSRVILAARWWYGEHVQVNATLETLANLNAETFVIGPGPTFDSPMESFATEAGFSGARLRDLGGFGPDRFAFDVAASDAELEAATLASGGQFFDRYATFCPDDLCPVFDGAEGPFLYFDDQHLSPTGLTRFGEALIADPALREFVAGRQAQ